MEAIHFPLDAVLGLTAPEGPDPVVNTWAARSVVMIGALM